MATRLVLSVDAHMTPAFGVREALPPLERKAPDHRRAPLWAYALAGLVIGLVVAGVALL